MAPCAGGQRASSPEFEGCDILITGGAGFVGSNLARFLLGMPIGSLHIIDNLLSSEKTSVPRDRRITFTEGSITDDTLLASIDDTYDYLFHLCAYHGNQSSICNPLADHDNNLLTTLTLFERIKNFKNLKKVVYSAAGCAVAEKTFTNAHATPEDAPISLDMDSPYSISKITGELYSVYYHRQHHLPTVRARFQNVYGPGEILGAGQWRGTPATVWRNVTPTFIYRALKQEPLPIEGKGDATRDFIYVDDIVRGLALCAVSGKPGDVYNLASGKETSILDLAHTINALTGNPAGVVFLKARDWDHSGRRFGSTEKSRRELGFTAEVELTEGLRRTIDWMQHNMDTIEDCIRKHRQHLLNAHTGA